MNVNGLSTHYVEAGEGPTVMLLHGGGPGNSALFTWEQVMADLGRRFHVVAPDQPGFGRSEHPRGGQISLLERVDHVAAFLSAMELGRVRVVGHSQGGFIGMRIALQQPEDIAAFVMVSSGTTAPLGNMDDDGNWTPAVAHYLSFSRDTSFENFVAMWSRLVYDASVLDRDSMRRHYDEFIDRGNLEPFVRGTEEALAGAGGPEAYALLHDEHIAPFIGQLAVPTLLVWGRDDDFAVFKRGQQLYDMIPGAEMHIFPRARHNVMMDHPRSFARVVGEFLGRSQG